MLFQALGSKYTYGDAWKHLVTIGSRKDSMELKDYLSTRFDGEVALYHKGRSALSEAIRIATGGEGKVAINGFTCYSVVQAVEAAGCEPVYVDINKNDLNFNVKALDDGLGRDKTIKCIVVQNTMGIVCDIESIKKIASKHEIIIIEDLAHALGADYENGMEVGTVGDITMLSFGRDKSVDVGSGGALIVRKARLSAKASQPKTRAKLIDSFRDRLYPILMWHARYLYKIQIGKVILLLAHQLKLIVRSADGDVMVNEKLPAWQAKRALEELENLEARRVNRLINIKTYVPKLPEDIFVKGVMRQGSVPLRLPILVEDREKLLNEFEKAELYLRDTWYDTPIGPKRFYSKVNYSETDCPVATDVARRIVNLPVHAGVTLQDIDLIEKLIKQVKS